MQTQKRNYSVTLEQTKIWREMTVEQQQAVRTFKAGRYVNGDQVCNIQTLADLQKANVWIMWELSRTDYRNDILGEIQSQCIIPLFQYHAMRLLR